MQQVQSYLSALVIWVSLLWQTWLFRLALRSCGMIAMMLIVVVGMKLIIAGGVGVDPWP